MVVTKHAYLAFGEKHVETYRKLGEALGKIANRDQFLLAMCLGFRNGTKVESFKRSNNGLRVEYLQPEDLAMMAAIQLAESEDPATLSDPDKGFTLAEQYAEGGILLLEKMMEEPGDFTRAIAGEVKSELDRLQVFD